MITIEEVTRRYALSVEEFLSWHNAMQRHGVQGLQITKLQNYRYSRPKKRLSKRAALASSNLEVLMRTVAVPEEVSAAVKMCGSAPNRPSTIRSGDLVVDLETRVVSVNDKPVRLTGKEYSILELLSLRRGTAVTREMLLAHLYGGIDEPGIKIIDVFVCHLRKKLAQATGGEHYIETIWGRGHMLRDPAPMPTANFLGPVRK